MIKNFRCPNGEIVMVNQCLHGCNHPCLAPSTRIFASKTRSWDGKTFSVTQLIQPTLLSYLKLTAPETIAPMDCLQAGMGTAAHALLEGCMPWNCIGEFRMVDDTGRITGQPDLVDLKHRILYDYKFVSAYSLAMMLGYERKGYYHEFKRGKRKGQKEWRYKLEPGGKPDYHGYDKQQNMYRILLKQNGIQIDKMILQAMAKEPDSQLKQLRLDRRAYLIEIPKYDDDEMLAWFYDRYDKLMTAMQTKTLPPKCEETWDGRRCENYCSVNMHCPYYKEEHK